MNGLSKEVTFQPNSVLNHQTKTNDINFVLIILFVFSLFLQQNFKFGPVQLSSVVSMLMMSYFVLESLTRGRFIIVKHKIQKPFLLLILWSLFSLIISYFQTIPRDVYNYNWVIGLNDPQWRGLSFFIRLFLSIFTIQFIISNVKTEKTYLRVIKYYILGYSILCIYVFVQIVLYGFFDITIGNIIPNQEGYFRVGGYIGEPGTLASILVSGYFLVFACAVKYYRRIRIYKIILSTIFLIATVDILFTFSAGWIPAVIIAGFILGRKYLSRKVLTYGFILIVLGLLFIPFFAQDVINRVFRESLSIGVRTTSWIAGFHILLNNPIAGVGIGNSAFHTPLYIMEQFKGSNWNIPVELFNHLQMTYYNVRFPPSNTYIQWGAETGIIGLLILAYLFYSIIKYGKNMPMCDNKFIVKFGFGGALLTFAIAMNAGPDNLYIGYINFVLAMYITGIKPYNNIYKRINT